MSSRSPAPLAGATLSGTCLATWRYMDSQREGRKMAGPITRASVKHSTPTEYIGRRRGKKTSKGKGRKKARKS